MYHLIVGEDTFRICYAPLTITQFRLGMVEHHNDHIAIMWNERKQTYELKISPNCPIRIADRVKFNRSITNLRSLVSVMVKDCQELESKETRIHGVAKPSVEELVGSLWPENRRV